jgi:hypothetical protein
LQAVQAVLACRQHLEENANSRLALGVLLLDLPMAQRLAR